MIKRGLALLTKRRDFRLLMGTQLFALAGDGLVQAALAKDLAFGGQKGFDLESARSPDEILLIALYIFVPYTVLSPFLGVVIDRWDRRRLLTVANGLRAVVIAAVGLIGSQDLGDTAVFIAFLLTLSSTRVVLATKAAALPATVEGDSLVEANAVSQLGGALFQLGGAGVAFVAARFVDVDPILLAGALVYLIGALFGSRIRRAGEPRAASALLQEVAGVARNIAAGLREVARTPRAGAAITTYFWLRFLWSLSLAGIGFVARDLLAGKDMLVLVVTGGAGAAGAVLAFVLAGALHARVRSPARLVLGGSLVAGGAVAALGALESEGALAVLTFMLGFGFFLGKISLDTLVQEALGDDFRGRAFSLYDIAYNLAWVVAAALMKVFWTELEGILVAAAGVAFLLGMVALAAWFRSAGLLVPRTPAPAASS